MRSIADEITELRCMSVADLVERYEAAFGKPPRVKHREWLWRRIAWKIQERRFGGLSTVAKKRLNELIGELDVPLGERTVRTKMNVRAKPSDPTLGTTLVRQWKGIEVTATRVDGGWDCDGVVHRSLSAAARAITLSHWNGPLFWGLRTRKGAPK